MKKTNHSGLVPAGAGVLNLPLPPVDQITAAFSVAAKHLGLSSAVSRTLRALLLVLNPTSPTKFVYASNKTLLGRVDQMSLRTLKSHLSALVEAGLAVRVNSANGKRFVRFDRTSGEMVRFGLNLAPFFERLPEIFNISAKVAAYEERAAMLRADARAMITSAEKSGLSCNMVSEMRRKVSRKTSVKQLERLIEDLKSLGQNSALGATNAPHEGENCTHHYNHTDSNIDFKGADEKSEPEEVNIEAVREVCADALTLAPRPLTDLEAMKEIADTLAPQMGIPAHVYEAARREIGPEAAALSVLMVLQEQSRLQSMPAYFRAITTGRRASTFNPFEWLKKAVAKVH